MLKTESRLPVLLASLLAAAVLALPAVPALASALPDYPFAHVTGNAFRMEMPDIATLDFQVVATDPDPAAARVLVEARIGEIHALLGQLEIPLDDMTVGQLRQGLRKERAAGAAPLFELSADVKIKLRQVGNWPRLADGVLGKPNIDGFAADFDLSTMDKANDELVAEAIADARRRAEVMASASGRRLGPVMAVSTEALKKLATRMGLEREEFRNAGSGRRTGNQRASEIDRETFLMVQMLKLGQAVDVVFRLENAGPAAPRAARKP